jgi:type VI secretion system secreted protein Hcp
MAVNIHVKLSEIEGEATDPKFNKQISALTYGWGLISPSGDGGSLQATGRVRAQDLVFTKRADKATTQLLHAMGTNKSIAKGVITLTKAGGKDPVDFLVITLDKVRVTAIRTKCSDKDGEEDYVEEVTLAFGQITQEYFAQDAKGMAKSTGAATIDFRPST